MAGTSTTFFIYFMYRTSEAHKKSSPFKHTKGCFCINRSSSWDLNTYLVGFLLLLFCFSGWFGFLAYDSAER